MLTITGIWTVDVQTWNQLISRWPRTTPHMNDRDKLPYLRYTDIIYYTHSPAQNFKCDILSDTIQKHSSYLRASITTDFSS